MRKTVSAILTTLLLNVAFGINVFAQTGSVTVNRSVGQMDTPQNDVSKIEDKADTSNTVTKKKFYTQLTETNGGAEFLKNEKSTLEAYEKQKAAGKKFSTTTKVLIGVGIAAAVVGVVIFAASRDKIRTF
jgi:hypothetical protein